MRYLSRGQESKRKVLLLLELTKITSEPVIAGIMDHLVRNHEMSKAGFINDCDPSSISVAVKTLNNCARINEALYDEKINGS